MSLGYEVCIHRDGRWEIYSFFDAEQENDAVYQARDISNNYQSVCVLWSTEMRVVYFNSKNKSDKKPTYMGVRGDLKLSQKRTIKPFTPSRRVIKKITPVAPKVKIPLDPYFTEEDQRQVIYKTLMTGFLGLFITTLAPNFLSENTDDIFKSMLIFLSFGLSMLTTVFVYQSSKDSARLKNQQKDFDHDASWRELGLSKDVLGKLKEEKSPQMKKALTKAIQTNTQNSIPVDTVQSKAPSTSKKQDSDAKEPKKVDIKTDLEMSHQAIEQDAYKVDETTSSPELLENSERIQAAIEAHSQEVEDKTGLLKNSDNSNFKLPKELSNIDIDDTQLTSALAEASVREVLAEMCKKIKEISYIKEKGEMAQKHEVAATLYLAGATSFMVNNLNLPTKLIRETVPLFLTRLDINPEISTIIMGQLSHYIHTSRHAIMFDTGVNDAKMRIETTRSDYTYKNALNDWLKLNEGVDANAFFTAVLFTDIENFTEQTQNKGESWMIDVLHAHNDIIRQSITEQSGHEIKHTGDGILATFNNVHKALQASIAIQRGIDIFCKTMPKRAFKMRIGITAGDIISIDNDIFGSPVNLCARIMNNAEGGEIITTDQVYGITHESDFNYEDKGEVALKGLQAQHIYLLNWQLENSPKD